MTVGNENNTPGGNENNTPSGNENNTPSGNSGHNSDNPEEAIERHENDFQTLDPRQEKKRLEQLYNNNDDNNNNNSVDDDYSITPIAYSSPEKASWECAEEPYDDLNAPDPAQPVRRFQSQPWRRRRPDQKPKTPKSRLKRCCRKTPKYLFFFFNIVLFLFGGALLGGSVWVRCQTEEFFEVEREESAMVSLLETCVECALAVGATFVGISLFGVVSECAKEPWCLIVYIIVTIIFLLCQLIPVCTFIENSGYYGDKVRGWMTQTLHDKYIGANPTGEHRNAYSFVFDALNMALECCGVNNGSDFVDRTDGFWKKNKLMEIGFEFTYPATCCKMNIKWQDPPKFTAQNLRCLFEPSAENTWLHVGCFERISGKIGENRLLLIGVFVAFVVFQFACLILAIVELCKITTNRTRRKEEDEEEEDMERRRLKRRSYDDYEDKRFREEF